MTLLIGLKGSEGCLAGSEAWLAGSWVLEGGQTDGRMDECTDGRTNGRTDRKSPHSTGPRPLSGPLQPENRIKRGKGTADHMMPLGAWFLTSVFWQRPR